MANSILVTGGNGFVGRLVCAKLLAQGFEVVTFDRKIEAALTANRHYTGDITHKMLIHNVNSSCTG